MQCRKSQTGLEPATYGLEVRRAIHYATETNLAEVNRTPDHTVIVKPLQPCALPTELPRVNIKIGPPGN